MLAQSWMKGVAVAAVATAALSMSHPAQAEDTLYVWAGDKAHKAADFFAVVDFDKESPNYGKILSYASVPKSLPSAIVTSNVPAGTIDLQLIPTDPKLRAFTAGVFDEKLYLIDPQAGTAQPVFDLSKFKLPGAADVWPHLIAINSTGKRLALTLNYKGLYGKVLWFNIENPERPTLINEVDLGRNSGPHYVIFSPTEDRLIVSDYFLMEDLFPSGVVKVEGDHKIHVLNVEDDKIVLDRKFDLDFNRDVATGPARPHGLGVVSKS